MRQSQLSEIANSRNGNGNGNGHGNGHGNGNGMCSMPLKINKDSHLIKKSSSPSSSSSSTTMAAAATVKPQQHRHPVIIYTHSPKIIHTNPRDFMALVQKLTGLSRSDDDAAAAAAQQAQQRKYAEKCDVSEDHQKKVKDDVESSSVITDENRCRGSAANIVGDGNSTFLPPIYETNPSLFGNFSFFCPNSNDFLGQSLYNLSDSMTFTPCISSSVSTFDGLNEFRDF